MDNIDQCPVCNSNSFQHFKTIKDYFLSGEVFQLDKCNNCGFIFLNPRPDKEKLQEYYQSTEYLSHSKSQRNLTSMIYDVIKNYSLHKKFQVISQYHDNGKILDIGCATGEFLNYYKKKGWQTLGIEPALYPRNYAIEKYGLEVYDEPKIQELEKNSFDVITLWHVLEHVPELAKRVEQIRGLLKNNGVIVIALPNHNSWDARHYDEYWAAYDAPRHLYHFSQDTFQLLLAKFQLRLIETIPLKFDAFYVSLLSEKYKTGKMKYVKACTNGIKSNYYANKNNMNYSSLIYIVKKQLE
jgi:2-polyprenyl-3-methyl-5-hydroxy-6-metoxy-1,4-benzoquinol methylase